MSAVTASIVVGTKHRRDPGIQPRWLLLLHEGRSYAWHLVKLQLTLGDLARGSLDDPPGILWQAGPDQDLIGEMALLIHLYAGRTPEIVQAAARVPGLHKSRSDLAALEEREAEHLGELLQLARQRGRELMLAATILPGSRLTEESLFELPDWELNISHTAITRDWASRQGFTVTDYRELHDVHEPHGLEGQGEGVSGRGVAAGMTPVARDLGIVATAASTATAAALAASSTHAADPGAGEQAGDTAAVAVVKPTPSVEVVPEGVGPSLRGRFGLRKHKPRATVAPRQRVGLAELLGRDD